MVALKTCPTCGTGRLRLVTRDVMREVRGTRYRVPALTFLECPKCGERLYNHDAMRKIEASRAQAFKTRARRKAAAN